MFEKILKVCGVWSLSSSVTICTKNFGVLWSVIGLFLPHSGQCGMGVSGRIPATELCLFPVLYGGRGSRRPQCWGS